MLKTVTEDGRSLEVTEAYEPIWSVEYYGTKFTIPMRMRRLILNYINYGIIPGDFLTAVLRNNLSQSIRYADEENLANIVAFCNFFYNHAPHSCWGSAEAVKGWSQSGGLQRCGQW